MPESTETPTLLGPEYSTEAPCPNCNEPVTIDGIMFVADGEEGQVEEVCHWCAKPYVVRRRTHFVGYTLTPKAPEETNPPDNPKSIPAEITLEFPPEEIEDLKRRFAALEPGGAFAVKLEETVVPELPPGTALDVEVDVTGLLRYVPGDLDPDERARFLDGMFRQIQVAVSAVKPGEAFVHADCIRIVGVFRTSEMVDVVPKVAEGPAR